MVIINSDGKWHVRFLCSNTVTKRLYFIYEYALRMCLCQIVREKLEDCFCVSKVLSGPSSTCRMESNGYHSAGQAQFDSS